METDEFGLVVSEPRADALAHHLLITCTLSRFHRPHSDSMHPQTRCTCWTCQWCTCSVHRVGISAATNDYFCCQLIYRLFFRLFSLFLGTYFGLLFNLTCLNLHACESYPVVLWQHTFLNKYIKIMTHKTFICNIVDIFFNVKYHCDHNKKIN